MAILRFCRGIKRASIPPDSVHPSNSEIAASIEPRTAKRRVLGGIIRRNLLFGLFTDSESNQSRWRNTIGYEESSRPTSSRTTMRARSMSRELRRYVDWLIERGVHGLYPNGSTGEFTRFTRRRAAAHHRDHCRPDRGAACRFWPAPPRPTSARRSRPASITPAWACGPSRSSRRFTTSSARHRFTPIFTRSAATRRST